jgi:hypothetical protein
MPVETRYFRGDTHTVNGLTAYILGTTQSDTPKSVSHQIEGWGYDNGQAGIQVWKRNAAGVETEITGGTPVAIVTKAPDAGAIVSATWACPSTSLASTDAIVVRVYIKLEGETTWTLAATFITEQLGAQSLDAATWTVYYYIRVVYDPSSDSTAVNFYWGTATYNSRIANFTWTPAPVAVKKPIMKMDLGPHPRSRLLFTRTMMLKGTGASSSPQPTLWDSWDYLWVAVL